MVGAFDLTHVLDIEDAVLAEFARLRSIAARQEVVHAGAPIVFARDAAPVSPVAVHEHAKRVQLAEGVVKAAVGEDALEGCPFFLSGARAAYFCLRVVNVLVVPNYV